MGVYSSDWPWRRLFAAMGGFPVLLSCFRERGRGCAAIQETPTIRPVMLPMRNIQRRRPEENDLQSRDFMTLYIRERWLKLHIHPSTSFLSSHATTTFTNSPLVMHLLFQADCFPQLRQAPSALYIFLYS